MKINEIITSVLLLSIIFILALVGLAFITGFLENEDTPSSNQKVSLQEDIPKTADEVKDAKWPTLLPSNQTDDVKQQNLNTSLSRKDLEKIRIFVLEFLKNYETFDPDRAIYAKANGREDIYQQTISRFIAPGAVSEIVSRSESNDIFGVCPFAESECQNGSVWLGGSAPDVKFLKDSVAYVTATGLVRYTSSDEFNSLKGRTGMKEYAIVLVASGDQWKVLRAISSIGEEVSI